MQIAVGWGHRGVKKSCGYPNGYPSDSKVMHLPQWQKLNGK